MTVVVNEYEKKLREEEWQRRYEASKPSGWGWFRTYPLLPPMPVAPWEFKTTLMDDGDLYGAAYEFRRPIIAQDLGI